MVWQEVFWLVHVTKTVSHTSPDLTPKNSTSPHVTQKFPECRRMSPKSREILFCGRSLYATQKRSCVSLHVTQNVLAFHCMAPKTFPHATASPKCTNRNTGGQVRRPACPIPWSLFSASGFFGSPRWINVACSWTFSFLYHQLLRYNDAFYMSPISPLFHALVEVGRKILTEQRFTCNVA